MRHNPLAHDILEAGLGLEHEQVEKYHSNNEQHLTNTRNAERWSFQIEFF